MSIPSKDKSGIFIAIGLGTATGMAMGGAWGGLPGAAIGGPVGAFVAAGTKSAVETVHRVTQASNEAFEDLSTHTTKQIKGVTSHAAEEAKDLTSYTKEQMKAGGCVAAGFVLSKAGSSICETGTNIQCSATNNLATTLLVVGGSQMLYNSLPAHAQKKISRYFTSTDENEMAKPLSQNQNNSTKGWFG